jgi:predicted nucleic acid-binding protein
VLQHAAARTFALSARGTSVATVRFDQTFLNTQVLQEFLVNVTRKISTPLAMSDARELIRTYSPWVRVATEPAMVLRATEIAEVWRLSFWDSMIVAGAEASGASVVCSEDVAHGQIISGIRIENPFRLTG